MVNKEKRGTRVACVSQPTAAPARVPLAPAVLVVVVVIAAYASLAALGATQTVALAGIAGAGALGVRLAAHLVRIVAGAGRV